MIRENVSFQVRGTHNRAFWTGSGLESRQMAEGSEGYQGVSMLQKAPVWCLKGSALQSRQPHAETQQMWLLMAPSITAHHIYHPHPRDGCAVRRELMSARQPAVPHILSCSAAEGNSGKNCVYILHIVANSILSTVSLYLIITMALGKNQDVPGLPSGN